MKNKDKKEEEKKEELEVSGAEDNASDEEAIDGEIGEAVKKLADKKPAMISEFMGMMGGSIGNPLHQKMDGEHINKLLDLAASHDEREYELHKANQTNQADDKKSNRRYYFAGFLVVTGLFIFLMVQFEDNPDILIPALTGLGGLVSGFLGGWGIGRKGQS